jgi:phosphate transport system substrate-binding protein
MMRSHTFRTAALAAGVVVLAGSTARAGTAVTLNETGSTLMYPLVRQWTEQYRRVAPNVRIPVDASNSGTGIEEAIGGRVAFGTSDAYMTDEQMKQSPGILNIALAISAQFVVFNLPGLNGSALRLDGPTLGGIYAGTIRSWDDPAIVAMNPEMKLPHHTIVPVHRNDSSGDSFIFSQFLTFSTDAWEFGPSYGTDVAWPAVPGAKGAVGNAGMVSTVAATPDAIGYVGGSFFASIAAARLGTATLKNQAGTFVAPSPSTVAAAARDLSSRTPRDERLSLVFAPGADAYPLVNYEYAIVAVKQPNPDTAAALRDFLLWTIGSGKGNEPSTLDPLHFTALPEYARALSDAQIRQIH